MLKCFYKPDRDDRPFTADDFGRIMRYARAAGATDKELCQAIAENGGLECGECDCGQLKAYLAIVVLVLTALAAARVNKKRSLEAAKEAIKRIQTRIKSVDKTLDDIGRIELEVEEALVPAINNVQAGLVDIEFEFEIIQGHLDLIEQIEDIEDEQLDRLNKEADRLLQDGFGEVTEGEEPNINIEG